jgi:biopolymer transport protein ExbD
MLRDLFKEAEESVQKAEISMTPLIDMVFLLLIFFVVTTTFTKETGIRVDKARAESSQIINRDLLIVAIDSRGAYWYDKKPRGIGEIVALVAGQARKNRNLNVVIVPDRTGMIDPLVILMDKLRLAGVNKFSIGTQRIEPDQDL